MIFKLKLLGEVSGTEQKKNDRPEQWEIEGPHGDERSAAVPCSTGGSIRGKKGPLRGAPIEKRVKSRQDRFTRRVKGRSVVSTDASADCTKKQWATGKGKREEEEERSGERKN